ncbi:hypothetical protein AB1Y20_003672 [Prymnesium parvum]|uniref:Uncharacterized protein n=1 Tax=Prymnesium parvum TaxID=97485 RepID=A0AB34J7I5_PRYPA
MVLHRASQGVYADMDLTGVISTLESHWVVLDAELAEIKKDFGTLRALTRKHGEFWNRSMAKLKKLRTQKETLLQEVKFQMELFNLHLNQGRDLCAKLSTCASLIKTPPIPSQQQLAIEVVSPILANSRNPVSVRHHGT